MSKEEPDDALNELSFKVIGAAMEVHKTLGAGLLEDVYEQALCIELKRLGLPYEKQKEIVMLWLYLFLSIPHSLARTKTFNATHVHWNRISLCSRCVGLTRCSFHLHQKSTRKDTEPL